MNPEAMLLSADVPGWLLNVRDWWMLNWLWVVRALVEIGVLAVVIYYAFQYLKRTRGWPVVAGFLALLALTLVRELLKLQVLSPDTRRATLRWISNEAGIPARLQTLGSWVVPDGSSKG